jgi:hypothetical protein
VAEADAVTTKVVKEQDTFCGFTNRSGLQTEQGDWIKVIFAPAFPLVGRANPSPSGCLLCCCCCCCCCKAGRVRACRFVASLLMSGGEGGCCSKGLSLRQISSRALIITGNHLNVPHVMAFFYRGNKNKDHGLLAFLLFPFLLLSGAPQPADI